MTPSEQLKELRSQIDAILNRGIEQFLLPFSSNTRPIYLYIQGYTPSFNDGDPCTHRSYVHDREDIISEGILEYESEFFGSIDEQQIEESLDPPNSEEFRDALEAVEEALEYKYGTDYQVLITLKDNNISYVRDHYDCGY